MENGVPQADVHCAATCAALVTPGAEESFWKVGQGYTSLLGLPNLFGQIPQQIEESTLFSGTFRDCSERKGGGIRLARPCSIPDHLIN
jgi:hypothetical protein